MRNLVVETNFASRDFKLRNTPFEILEYRNEVRFSQHLTERFMYVQDANIPPGKKTVPGLYVTAKEAYEKWKSSPEKIKIIDVRTQEEFLFVGFPPMAWKIPVAVQSFVWDNEKKQYPLLPKIDFVNRVKEIADEDDTLMIMCRSGGRSAIAVNMLAEAGFKQVYQIVDGMEGDIVTDEDSVFKGQRMMNGWKNAGCPWTNELSPWRLLLPTLEYGT